MPVATMGDGSSFSLSGLLDELEQEFADEEPAPAPTSAAPVEAEAASATMPLTSTLDSSLTGLLERLELEEMQNRNITDLDLRKSSCLPLTSVAQSAGQATHGCNTSTSVIPRPWVWHDQSRVSAIISRAEDANPSFRNHMEDGVKVVDPFPLPGRSSDETWGFFAVYDGHGGREAVDYCETRMQEQLLIEMGKLGPGCDISRVLSLAFQSIDSQLAMYGAWNHGSTATVALVQRRQGSGTKLYIANVGDSRSVLFGNGSVTRVSRDHRPDDVAEARRVVEDGGKVVGNRVGGDLAISRSLGDHRLKGRGVSCIPDVRCCSLSSGDVLITASDGLWDVLSDDDACHVVESSIQQVVDLGIGQSEVMSWLQENTAQELVDEAKKLGSQDNILVLVLFF